MLDPLPHAISAEGCLDFNGRLVRSRRIRASVRFGIVILRIGIASAGNSPLADAPHVRKTSQGPLGANGRLAPAHRSNWIVASLLVVLLLLAADQKSAHLCLNFRRCFVFAALVDLTSHDTTSATSGFAAYLLDSADHSAQFSFDSDMPIIIIMLMFQVSKQPGCGPRSLRVSASSDSPNLLHFYQSSFRAFPKHYLLFILRCLPAALEQFARSEATIPGLDLGSGCIHGPFHLFRVRTVPARRSGAVGPRATGGVTITAGVQLVGTDIAARVDNHLHGAPVLGVWKDYLRCPFPDFIQCLGDQHFRQLLRINMGTDDVIDYQFQETNFNWISLKRVRYHDLNGGGGSKNKNWTKMKI